MTEQVQDSTVTPSAVLAAQIIAPAATGSVVSAANLPGSGTFTLLLKGDADDGSDDGIIAVGAIAGTALSSITWVENGQGTFPAATEVELDLDARALKAVIDERSATVAASAVSTHSGATDPHGDRAYADDLPGRLIARTDLRVEAAEQGGYTGTFTPDPATRKIVVEMVGGGGGGGGVTISTSGAASGGGGAFGNATNLRASPYYPSPSQYYLNYAR